ncbi:hypothetical protein Vi05172_g6502 [Venturia inaequalis]|nr:hypothetical protein Vi05172_g6502 [Venturia inaequalis]
MKIKGHSSRNDSACSGNKGQAGDSFCGGRVLVVDLRVDSYGWFTAKKNTRPFVLQDHQLRGPLWYFEPIPGSLDCLDLTPWTRLLGLLPRIVLAGALAFALTNIPQLLLQHVGLLSEKHLCMLCNGGMNYTGIAAA